ncbi:hypothetical protein SLUN_36975 [Streptomyces lunaelactis]|uniref:Uncharacterized protein n=1 Tax=Streptomyces lunaelactis TaxID=1535768 RepID=A0A2R4TCW9_9ACTN|nr:hypothetical protein SLUN_36975 [Streptomyces lunaelactis]
MSEVLGGQSAAGCRDQAEEFAGQASCFQHGVEAVLGFGTDSGRVGRSFQAVVDLVGVQRVAARNVVWDRWMRATGDEYAGVVRGRGGQESSDAVAVACPGDATVFVKAVDHQHETFAVRSAASCGPVEGMQEVLITGVFARGWFLFAEQCVELALHHFAEGGTVVLTGEASGDEEGHHHDVGRRGQNKMRHERSLACPRRGQPTPPPGMRALIGMGVRSRTKGRHGGQLLFAALEAVGRQSADLVQVSGDSGVYRRQDHVAVDDTCVDEGARSLRVTVARRFGSQPSWARHGSP